MLSLEYGLDQSYSCDFIHLIQVNRVRLVQKSVSVVIQKSK